ncbi:cancer-associated gene 1 protein homolog [Ambystoma mexicanum]|uniref:cancer-associated gene 1 protein homolog n=1 Tax=Ambystoma mexicanum TaxID=8296 RepID=UPI0037E74874
MDQTGMFQNLGFKEEDSQRSVAFGEISKSEENACTQEPLVITPEEELSSLGSCSQDLPHGDSLFEYESSVLASEISQDEVGDLMKKNDPNYAFRMQGQVFLEGSSFFHPEIDDMMYDADFEDFSQKERFSLSKSDTGPISYESDFGYGWKESYRKEKLIFHSGIEEPSGISGSLAGNKNDDRKKEDDVLKQDGIKYSPRKESPLASVLPISPDEQILQCDVGILTVMQEPLLDCIVRESPNKDVSSFLAKSHNSLISESREKNMTFSDTAKPFNKEGLHLPDESNHYLEHEVESGPHLSIAEASGQNQIMSTHDSLDKHIALIKSFMQSNKNVKAKIKNNLLNLNIKMESKEDCLSAKGIEVDHPDLLGTNTNSSASKQENMTATTQAGTDTEDQGRKVVKHSNSLLSVQVSSLQEEIEKLKEANHFLGVYENIINLYEEKHSQLAAEKLHLEQMTTNLNTVIKKLEQDQKRHQAQNLNLQYDNLTLMTKIKELQLEITERETCTVTITKMEHCIRELTDSNSQVLIEKQAIERSLKCLQDDFAHAQQQLQESGAAGTALKRQLDKLRSDHSALQEKHKAEVEQKNKYMNQGLEMDYAICKKEEELEELRQANGKLASEEKAATLGLQQLREEKESTEKQLLALQMKCKREMDLRVAEKEQLETRYRLLSSEVEILQENFENEQLETANLEQHMDVVMKESLYNRQQAAMYKDLNHQMLVEIESWRRQFEKVLHSQREKEQIHNQAIQKLRSEKASLMETLKKKEEEMDWKMHMLGRLLLDMKAVHSDLSMRGSPGEADCFNSSCVRRAKLLLSKISGLLALTDGILLCQDIIGYSPNNRPSESCKNENIGELMWKIKDLNNQKETLEKEVTGSPKVGNITSQPNLLTEQLEGYRKEKEQDQKLIHTLQGLLDLKSEECFRLMEENDKLQKELNNLICKVASFEEIVQCADQRLEMYNAQVSQLEKRNHHLEVRMKKLKEKSRQHRQKRLAKQSKSCTALTQIKEFGEANNRNLVAWSQNAKFECGDTATVTQK